MNLEAVPDLPPCSCLLLLFQHFTDLFFQVFTPEIFGHDAIFFVENESAGNSFHAILGSDFRMFTFQIGYVFPVTTVLADSGQPSLFVCIDRYTDDLQTLRTIAFVNFNKVHVLCPAGTTPRCPKVNDFYLALGLV